MVELAELMKRIKNFGAQHKSYWGCALAGEVGEACNLIKKHERDGKDIKEELALELADVFIYTVLTARVFDIDLEASIINKIKIVDKRNE